MDLKSAGADRLGTEVKLSSEKNKTKQKTPKTFLLAVELKLLSTWSWQLGRGSQDQGSGEIRCRDGQGGLK